MKKIKFSQRTQSFGGKTIEHKGIQINNDGSRTSLVPYSENGESRLLKLSIPNEDLAKIAVALIGEAGIFEVRKAFKEYLAQNGAIALIWDTDDVEQACEGITTDRAWEVLKQVEKYHDASIGVSWDVIRITAENL